LKIALFDITPLPDGTTAFGALKNYYSVATISKFVVDSLDACEAVAAGMGKPVQIFLKHKRAPRAGRHATTYLDLLQELVRTRGNFQLIEHHSNLFELLGECHLSISVPYTSTAYVASFLSKPAIYYDSSAELVANFERNEFVHFAAGPRELQSLIDECLRANGSMLSKPDLSLQ
jgi:polysaccharide biosynthesis PFTS motif protein